jgi:hypothetical protein
VRWVFLIVGLAAGFGLGYALREPDEARATRRPAGSAAPDVLPSRAAAPEPVRRAPAPRKEPRLLVPTEEVGTEDVTDGWGQVRVDFAGSGLEPEATLVGPDMFGNPEEETTGGEPVVFDVRTGRYLVWWLGGDGEQLGAHVRVESGRITRVKVAQGLPLPLPEGLGRIDVFVESLEGGPLPRAAVQLDGEGEIYSEGTSALTGSRGRCQFRVIPGDFLLTLGGREMEVEVQPATVAKVHFRHAEEGDVLIRGGPKGTGFVLTRHEEARQYFGTEVDGETAFHYVPPGTYAVTARIYRNSTGDERGLGRLVVKARRRTEFNANLPTGSVRIRLLPPSGRRRGKPRLTLLANDEAMRPQRIVDYASEVSRGSTTYWKREFVALSPGTYTVQVKDKYWAEVDEPLHIGNGHTELDIELEPR